MTIVAIWVSGSIFFTILSKTYSDGFYYTIALAGMASSFLISAFIFIPRMKEFLGSTSVAESLGNFYGNEVRLIVATASIIGSVGTISVQFKAFGNIFDYFLGVSGIWAVIAAGSIVTFYSAFGGIRFITFTDILQFFTFGFGIPLIGFLIWNQVTYSDIEINFAKTLQEPKFNLNQIFKFNNPKLWEMIPVLLYFAIPSMTPAFYQRVAIGRSIAQVKEAFIISAGLVVAINMAIAWIPFLIYTINPNLQPHQVLGFIIDNYTYPGLRGLMMIGITAMAMSCLLLILL